MVRHPKGAQYQALVEQREIVLEMYNARVSMTKIAKRLQCDRRQVAAFLKEINVLVPNRRNPREGILLASKEEVVSLYLEGMTQVAIADKFGVAYNTVVSILEEEGITLRKYTRQQERSPRAILTKVQQGILDGLIMSDGHLTKDGRNSSLEVASKHEEFVRHLQDVLPFKSSVGSVIVQGITYYRYKSEKNCFLTDQRKRWYPDNVKRIPDDIEVNPALLRYLLYGDGQKEHTKKSVAFHLQCFPLVNLEMFCDRLLYQSILVGWTCKDKKPGQYIVRIGVKSFLDFYNYIGDCDVDCFQYKFV